MRLIAEVGKRIDTNKIYEYVNKHDGTCLITVDKIDGNVAQMMKYYRSSVIKDIADFLGESNLEEAHQMVLEEFSPTVVIGEYEVRLTTRAFDKDMWLAFLKAVTTTYLMMGANITPADVAGYEYESESSSL